MTLFINALQSLLTKPSDSGRGFEYKGNAEEP